MCYTNHALDQFLEDLLDIGIDASSIVRLGSKSTQRTEPLSLFRQHSSYKRNQISWNTINSLESDAQIQASELQSHTDMYQNQMADAVSILDYLEFEDPKYFEALTIPDDDDDMTLVTRSGKAANRGYLFNRWIEGKSPGIYSSFIPSHCQDVWALGKEPRNDKLQSWRNDLLAEQAASLGSRMSLLDKCQKRLSALWGEKTRVILKSKRIIGCTTTAAAMYSDELRHVSPGIMLLEEAGEVLESHVLTAMCSETKHLVLIGDHKQLRPKINSYSLSAEKGDGYDLNVSLFERLINAGYPHTTLLKQHRMCPEISGLVRSLTYPGLEDDDSTKDRPQPRGLRDRLIFFHHKHPEAGFAEVADRRDEGAKMSRKNVFEAEIVLKIVKYLGQQGYGTDKIVVLTPYLGQLSLLRDTLRSQNDPVLNDLDTYDLLRAGLLSQASANHSKRQLKLSTIGEHMRESLDATF
jgi:hypothetical protein